MINLISIQAGMPKTYGDSTKKSFEERAWRTGFFKNTVVGDVEIDGGGIVTDGQADLKVHGGPDKAICVYPKEHFGYWKERLGLSMDSGAFGENFTVSGGLEPTVCIGDIYGIDEVIFQVTQPRQPCWKLARRWECNQLGALAQDMGKTGWYLRILSGGIIQAPNKISLLERRNERWTIERCNQVMHHAKNDLKEAFELAQVPELSNSWRRSLMGRVEGKKSGSEKERLGL